MSLSRLDLEISKYIQRKNKVDISEVEVYFNRSSSTIKRSIETLKSYAFDITLKSDTITSNFSYKEYISTLDSLKISNYSPTKNERVNSLLVLFFLNIPINKTEFYENLGFSESTLKNDISFLKKSYNIPRFKNLRHEKDNIFFSSRYMEFRLILTNVISKISDLTRDDNLLSRKANSPMERHIFSIFFDTLSIYYDEALTILYATEKAYSTKFSYVSRKNVMIYLLLAFSSLRGGNYINKPLTLPLDTPSRNFIGDFLEDQHLNYIIAISDFTTPLPLPIDREIKGYVKRLIILATKSSHYSLKVTPKFQDEVYQIFYKSILKNHYKYHFKDEMLERTHLIYQEGFNIITNTLKEIGLQNSFTYEQRAMLTLTFEKFMMDNPITNTKPKKIVIVTNSNFEKLSFFKRRLTSLFEVKIVSTLNINELPINSSIIYDNIIVFSTRIGAILDEYHLPYTRISLLLTQEDLEHLFNNGIPLKNKKIDIMTFVEEISSLDKNQLISLLKDSYSNFFT